MTLGEFLRCLLSRGCRPGYDPDGDDYVRHLRDQRAASEERTETLRRRRATGALIADALGDREGRRRFEAEGGRG